MMPQNQEKAHGLSIVLPCANVPLIVSQKLSVTRGQGLRDYI